MIEHMLDSSPTLSTTDALDALLAQALPAQKSSMHAYWPAGEDLLRASTVVRAVHPNASGPALLDLLLARASWSVFQERFSSRVLTEPGVRGRVLDVGCGGALPECVADLATLTDQLDGVDPSPLVRGHPLLTERFHGAFESAPIAPATYDLAYAYNVVEHIEQARPFFQKLRSVLKPGGVFWALTPNSRHPFAKLSRALEVTGIKWLMARRMSNVNNYSAYYRLNSEPQVTRAIAGLGFVSAQFFYADERSWVRGYFPRGMRWIGTGFDNVVASAIPSRKLLLYYRLVAGE